MDILKDGYDFYNRVVECTGKTQKFDMEFVVSMVKSEMQELLEAKDDAERIDAMIDGIYYISSALVRSGGPLTHKICINLTDKNLASYYSTLLITNDDDHELAICISMMMVLIASLARFNLNMVPIWDIVHEANMRKFSGDGHLLPCGKWQKPSDFVPPDQDIRDEIRRQRQLYQKNL